MTYLSIIEKFKILLNTLLDFKPVLMLTILLIIITLMYILKKISAKKYILFMIVSFIIIFAISIANNYKVLSNTFDNFITIFFGNIYFPSIYVYIGILVVSFIVFIISIFNIMIKRIYKLINTSMFVINNIFFVIILNIIAKNKIDIFSVNSLYTNTELVAMLELSMGLCIVWVLSLISAYVTNVICDRLTYNKICSVEKEIKDNENKIFNPILEYNVNITETSDVIVNTNDNYMLQQIDNYNYENQEEVNTIYEDEIINNNEINESIIEAPIIIEEPIVIENAAVIEEKSNISNESRNMLSFNDILNENIEINYNTNINDSYNNEYPLFNPQKEYEDKYSKIIDNMSADSLEEDVKLENVLLKDNEDEIKSIIEKTVIDENVHEVKNKEKIQNNTISLNDLIIEEKDNTHYLNDIIYNDIELSMEEEIKNNYSIEDYKKIAEMLKNIKTYTNNSNINIDDAVAINLIRNYSVDECLKFKNILENNLN